MMSLFQTKPGRLGSVLLALAMLATAGCRRGLQRGYGQRLGPGAGQSVNGTAVFGQMFEEAGHSVYSWDELSPRLNKRADVIVWFPDDFELPTDEVRKWLEAWLEKEPERTLIYVGRDFDAAVWYWKKVMPRVPRKQKTLAKEESDAAKVDYDLERQAIPDGKDCGWFKVDDKGKRRRIRGRDVLAGSDPEWTKDIDQTKLDIELRSRFVLPPPQDEPVESTPLTEPVELLPWDEPVKPRPAPKPVLVSMDPKKDPKKDEPDVLLSVAEYDNGSKRFVVTNGSFLLNASLVNHEHRKLAGKLIDEVGPPRKTVIFLESYGGGPPISTEEIPERMRTGFEIWLVFPAGIILFHLAAPGIFFCFSRWPIFGVPRELPPAATSDFGKHIEALAKLLKRSGDRAYALSRFLHYQQTTRPTSDHE